MCSTILNDFLSFSTMKYEMNVDEKAREAGMARQLNLFWFQEPQFVISIIQFMQFGYALALAIVLMYWTSLTAIEPYWFLLAVVVCYGIFVFVLSMALPQYTLCTSLGYLVDQKNLMETVAVHRLEEARRLQLRTHTARFNFDDDSMIAFETHNDGEILQMEDSIKWGSSGRSNQSGLSIDSQRSTDKTQILAELVKSDTSSLRNLLPESSREILRSRERRRDRRKSVSDGVALMRALGGAIGDVASPSRTHPSKSHQLRAVDDSDILKRDRAERAAKRKARKKTASASEVIQSWHNMTKPGTKKLDENSSALGSGDQTIPKERMQQRAERIAQRRQSRLKSKSESAVIRKWNGSTAAEEDWRAIREQKLLTKARDHESIPVMEAPDLPPVDEAALPLPIQRRHGTQSDRKLTTQSSHQSIQDENSTLRTDESVGLLSDVDVQQWDAVGDIESNLDIKRTWNLGKMVKVARDYFLDDRYHTISHVFGSLIVFFLVGHRLEVMLSKTGAVDPSENTWELDLGVSFWIETFWLAFFIIAGTLILLLFLPVEEKSTNHRVVITSAVLDILLSCACLAILFLAEAQRCCDGDEPDRGIDCCPFWGSRTHSGLGDLEPFTALIGLRVFRFVVSRQLVEYFDDRSEMGIGAEERGKEALEQHSRHGNNLVGSSMQTETGTPLVLWETAISKYPDIVEKYGELSTELFQAMLGLIDANSIQPTGHSSVQLDNKVTHQLSSSDDGQHGIKIGENQSIKLSGTRYATLPAEAQSIIIAGKLGMPVKSIKRLRENRTDLPAVFEEPEHDTFGFHQPSSVQGTAKFEIDSAKLALEETSPSNFLAPNARLIRSMRRCDRRMLPILTDWGCVDVVITQFEMVYFEAVRLIEPASPNLQDHPSLLALQATKGGKGLRLHDVAMGRKIVGHLDLSDITEVHVDRSLALPDSATTKSPTAIEADDVAIPTEFWSKPGSGGCTKHKRQARWAKIKEDRLRLVTLHGCLVLRFYSDLDDVEVNAAKSLREDEAQGALRKNIALQWAQTISHSVGREKLHQPLPNFGANNSDELRDLLQAKNFHEKEQEENLKSSNGFGPTTLGASTEVPTKEVRSKPSFRRSRSLSSDDTFKHRLRRHLSMSAVGELANETKPVKDGVTSNDTETIDASLQQQGRGHITF
eukprot:scaffold1118_cov135-Cylindrotheca_fusiformis.AAC.14